MMHSRTLVVLEIGNWHISSVYSRKSGLSKKDTAILAAASVRTKGFQNAIKNRAKLCESVSNCLSIIEAGLKRPISGVYLGIPSDSLSYAKEVFTIEIANKDGKVELEDITKLKNMSKLSHRPGRVWKGDLEYMVDGVDRVSSPIGMYAKKFTAKISSLQIPIDDLDNLVNVITSLGIDVLGVFIPGITVSETIAVNKLDVLLDIGYRKTRIFRWISGKLMDFDFIDFGGNEITLFLSGKLHLSVQEAEKFKMSLNKNIRKSVFDLAKDCVSQKVDEFCERLNTFFDKKYPDRIANVAITGGGMYFPWLEKKISQRLKADVFYVQSPISLVDNRNLLNPVYTVPVCAAKMFKFSTGPLEAVHGKVKSVFYSVKNIFTEYF